MPFGGLWWWSSADCDFGYRDQVHDHDAKPATLVYLGSSRNEQVKALNVDEHRGETTAPLW